MGVIFLNYYEIGQKIRKFRKAQGFSQEELAEKIGISVTHMSHIETGNTKLSLPVFVDIANALDVQTDDLLNDRNVISGSKAKNELTLILENCTTEELCLITDITKTTLSSLKKYIK